MKFLITTTYYERFSLRLYQETPELSAQPYQEQLQHILNQCFGTSDFFSANLHSLGHEAEEIIVNCDVLQKQWTREFAPSLAVNPSAEQHYAWQHAVLQAQIERFKPDVLYIHDVNWTQGALLRAVRPHIQLIIGQNACPLRPQIDYGAYDLLLTSFPHYVDFFRHQGVKSEYFRLAFEPRVLEHLNRAQTCLYQVGFIGGFSVLHRHGNAVLEQVAQTLPMDVWGYGFEDLPQDAPLRQRYHGEAWGIDMFRNLAACKIALNRHIDVAQGYANNMRLYEATGVGTCLVTDMKNNLHELFEPDQEVVTYRSPQECVEKIRYLLEHEAKRAEIAQAGQARTLREHRYAQRMQELEEIVYRYLPHSTPKRSYRPMFWDDIKLVTEQIQKYGLRKPLVDLGGLERPVIADYELTIQTKDQQARFVRLTQRPFDHIDPSYLIVNPEKGDPPIEQLPSKYPHAFGTAVCLSVLEHVHNPFEVFKALYHILKPNGLLMISTVFTYPYHPSPDDYWRFSPACLRYLSESVGFTVLECDWRLRLSAHQGVLAAQEGAQEGPSMMENPLEIKSVYITLTKGDFIPMQSKSLYPLPQRISGNQAANQRIAGEQGSLTAQPKVSPSRSKNVLFYTDESEEIQHHDAILRELVASHYQVTCVQPKGSPSHPVEHVQYRELGFDPVEEFERTMTHLEEAGQILSNIQPTLIIFSDACPFSNLALKKVAAQLNIPYLILVNLVAYELAELYATHLEELTQSYEHAQAVMVLSPEDLHTLRQYFRLPPHQGRILGESHLGQSPKEPKNIQTIQPFKKEEQQTISVQVPPPPSHRPHWEYLPQGWATQDSRIQGWNVQSILNTQRAKWSAFAAALQGTGPLGISHEAPNISNDDYSAHNTVMTFGYVLALAARKKEQISILDWGGGLGHYYLLSQALLPEVKIDYYCKEVPVLCQGGREVLPQVTFFEDEQACFNRRYDLVLCSSSLQYSQNWKQTVQQLVSITGSYLYITRLPIVHHAPSFVVVQRPYQYGYHTEYKTWFLNRQEFLNYATQLPIKLVREFLIIERFPVPGAPEEGEARGFLFDLQKEAVPYLQDNNISLQREQINMFDYHRLNLNDPIFKTLISNPHLIGLSEEGLKEKQSQQRMELIVGEYLIQMVKQVGELASNLLFKAQWSYAAPEWFDHRHHLIYPEKHFNDYWTLSADNVIPVLPFQGTLLDLCAGDGFYDYYYYAKRAKEVVCVENNSEVYQHALRVHSAQNIRYILADVLTYQPAESCYDVVVIRGAIEHFSQENQQIIFKKALKTLKPGGWFCGDTPANPDKHHTLLEHHQHEWANEAEMKQELGKVFNHVEAYTVVSKERVTLFWRCRKTK